MVGVGVGTGVSRGNPGAAFVAKGGSPPYPAPAGYKWEIVTANGQKVTANNQNIFVLVGA